MHCLRLDPKLELICWVFRCLLVIKHKWAL